MIHLLEEHERGLHRRKIVPGRSLDFLKKLQEAGCAGFIRPNP